MADTVIQLSVQFKDAVQNFKEIVAQYQKELDKLTPGTSLYKGLESQIKQALSLLKKTDLQANLGITKEGQLTTMVNDLGKVELILNNVKGAFSGLNLKDLNLSNAAFQQPLKDIDELTNKMDALRNQVKQLEGMSVQKLLEGQGDLLKDFNKGQLSKGTTEVLAEMQAAAAKTKEELEKLIETKERLVNQKNESANVVNAGNPYYKDILALYDNAKALNPTGSGRISKDGILASFQNMLNTNWDASKQQWTDSNKVQELLKLAGFDDATIQQVIQASTNAAQVLADHFKNLKSSELTKGLTDAAKDAKNVAGAQTAVDNAQKQINDISRKIGRMEGTYAKQTRGADSITNALNQRGYGAAQANIDNIQSQIKQLWGRVEEIGRKVGDVPKAPGGDPAAQMGLSKADAQKQMGSAIDNMARRWIGTYAIVNKVRRSIRQAWNDIKNLDKAMTNIAVVTNMSVDDLWGKIGDYMAIAQQYGVTTQGVYEVSQIYYQQGLGTEEVMAATTETLKMARIADMDYAAAADAMTVAIRAFKMEMTDAQRVTDVYSKVASITASDSEELAIAMSKTASSAESVGSSFENTTAMLAVMVETTRESAQNLGSALKSIISRYGEMKSGLTQDSEGEIIDYNKTDAALRSIGISLKDAQGQFRDFDDVIFELSEKWDTLDKNTQRYIATVMAGNRQQSRFIALVDNWERLEEVSDAANNDADDAGLIQYSKTLDSLDAKINNLKTSFQELYMSIANGPAFKGILDFINNVLQGFTKFKTGLITFLPSLIISIRGIFQAIKLLSTKFFSGLYTNAVSSFTQIANYKIIIHKSAEETMSDISRAEEAERLANSVSSSQMSGQAKVSFWKNPKGKKFGAGSAAAGAGGMLLTMAGTGLSMWGASKAGEGGSENLKSGAILSGAGTAASLAGMGLMVGGVPGLIIGGIAGIIAGAIQATSVLSDKIALLEADIKKAEEDQEEAELKKAETKQEYNSLDNYIKQLEKLQGTRYNSAESEQQWIELNNEIFEAFPELAAQFDNAGNAIIDLASAEELLSSKRKEAADAAIQAADAAVTTEAYKLSLDRQKINEYVAATNNAASNLVQTNLKYYNLSADYARFGRWAEDWKTPSVREAEYRINGDTINGNAYPAAVVNPQSLYANPSNDNRVFLTKENASLINSNYHYEGASVSADGNIYYNSTTKAYEDAMELPSVFLYPTKNNKNETEYEVLSKSNAVKEMLPYLSFSQEALDAGILTWLDELGKQKTGSEFASVFLEGFSDFFLEEGGFTPLELFNKAMGVNFNNSNFDTYDELIQMNNLLKRQKAGTLDYVYNSSVKQGINTRTQSMLSYYEEDSLKALPNIGNIINDIAYKNFTASSQTQDYETYFDVNTGKGQQIIEQLISDWETFYSNTGYSTIQNLSELMANSTQYTPADFENKIESLVNNEELRQQIINYYKEQYKEAYERFSKSLQGFTIAGKLEDYKIPQELFEEVSSFGEHLQDLIAANKISVEDGNSILQSYLNIYKGISSSELFSGGKNHEELFKIQSLLANADYSSPKGIVDLLNSLEEVYALLGQPVPDGIKTAVENLLNNSLVNLHTSYVSYSEELASSIDALAEDLEKAQKGFKDFKDVVEFANKYDLSLNDFSFDKLTGQWLSTSEVYQAIYNKQKKDYEDLKTQITTEAGKQRQSLQEWAGEDTEENKKTDKYKYIMGTDWQKKSYEDLKYDLGFYNKDTGEINKDFININNIFASNWDRYVDWYEKVDETQRKSFYEWMLLEQKDTIDALDSASKKYLDYLANDSNRMAALNSGKSEFDKAISEANYFENIKNQAFKSLSSKYTGLSTEEIEGYGYDIFNNVNAFYDYTTQNLDGTWDLNLSKLKNSPLWEVIPTKIKNTILSIINQESLSAKEALNNLATKLGSGETTKVSDYQAILGEGYTEIQKALLDNYLQNGGSIDPALIVAYMTQSGETDENAAKAALESARGGYLDSVEETQSKLYDLYLKRIDGTITNAEEKLIAQYEAVVGDEKSIKNLNIKNKVQGYLQMVNAFLAKGTEEAIDNAIEAYKKAFKEKRKNAGKDKIDISNTIKESDGFYKEEDVAEFLGRYGIRLTEQELNEIFSYDELTGDLVLASAEQAEKFYNILRVKGGPKALEAFKVSEAEKILNKAIEKSETQDSIQSTLESFYGDLSSVTINQLSELYKSATGAESIDKGTVDQFASVIEQARNGVVQPLIDTIRYIQFNAELNGYKVDTSALEAAYQDAADSLVSSLISILEAAIGGTLSATDMLTLEDKLGIDLEQYAIKTVDGWQINTEGVLQAGAKLKEQYGSAYNAAAALTEVFVGEGKVFSGSEEIEKEIAALKSRLELTRQDGLANEEIEKSLEQQINLLTQMTNISRLNAEDPIFDFMNKDATSGMTQNFDTLVGSIETVKSVFESFKSEGYIGYNEFYNLMDFLGDNSGWKSFIESSEGAGMAYEDFVNLVVEKTDEWGQVDIGAVAAELGISVEEAMTKMDESMVEGLTEVAKQQIKYLSGLEKMLEAMAALEAAGDVSLGITITTTVNGKPQDIEITARNFSQYWDEMSEDQKKAAATNFVTGDAFKGLTDSFFFDPSLLFQGRFDSGNKAHLETVRAMSSFIAKTVNLSSAEWLAIGEQFWTQVDKDWYTVDEKEGYKVAKEHEQDIIKAWEAYMAGFDPNNIDLSSISTFNSQIQEAISEAKGTLLIPDTEITLTVAENGKIKINLPEGTTLTSEVQKQIFDYLKTLNIEVNQALEDASSAGTYTFIYNPNVKTEVDTNKNSNEVKTPEAAKTFLDGALQFLKEYGFTSTDNKNWVYELKDCTLRIAFSATSTIDFDFDSLNVEAATITADVIEKLKAIEGFNASGAVITYTDPVTQLTYTISTTDIKTGTPTAPKALTVAELSSILTGSVWTPGTGTNTWTSTIAGVTFSYNGTSGTIGLTSPSGVDSSKVTDYLKEKFNYDETNDRYISREGYIIKYNASAENITITKPAAVAHLSEADFNTVLNNTDAAGKWIHTGNLYTRTTPYGTVHYNVTSEKLSIDTSASAPDLPTVAALLGSGAAGEGAEWKEEGGIWKYKSPIGEVQYNASTGKLNVIPTESGAEPPSLEQILGITTNEDGTTSGEWKEKNGIYVLSTPLGEIGFNAETGQLTINTGSKPVITSPLLNDILGTDAANWDLTGTTYKAVNSLGGNIEYNAETGKLTITATEETDITNATMKDICTVANGWTPSTDGTIFTKTSSIGTVAYNAETGKLTVTAADGTEITDAAMKDICTVANGWTPSTDGIIFTKTSPIGTVAYNAKTGKLTITATSETDITDAAMKDICTTENGWDPSTDGAVFTKTSPLGTVAYNAEAKTLSITPASDISPDCDFSTILSQAFGTGYTVSGSEKEGYTVKDTSGNVILTIPAKVTPSYEGSGLNLTDAGLSGSAQINLGVKEDKVGELLKQYEEDGLNININLSPGSVSNSLYDDRIKEINELVRQNPGAIFNEVGGALETLTLLEELAEDIALDAQAGFASEYDIARIQQLTTAYVNWVNAGKKQAKEYGFNVNDAYFTESGELEELFKHVALLEEYLQTSQTENPLAASFTPIVELFSDATWVSQLAQFALSITQLSSSDLSTFSEQLNSLYSLEFDSKNIESVITTAQTLYNILLPMSQITIINPTITIDTTEAQNNLDRLKEVYDDLEDKEITVTVNTTGFNQQWTGTMNNISGSALADGSIGRLRKGASLAQKTLVGELGPELAVYDGQYHMLGANGAEFVKLPNDAIVFNHLQTEGILNGQMNIRGKAMAEGNATGPALASGGGIQDALAAVKRAKSVWQGLLNSLSVGDLLGGGGGGGGDNSIKAHTDELQEWYNLSRKIAYIEQEINNLLAERANIQEANGEAYLRNLREQEALLREQVATQDTLLRYQQMQLDRQAEHINNNEIWSQFLEVDENGLLQYRDGNELFGKGALSVLDELNKMSGQKQYDFITKKLGYSYTDQDGKELKNEELITKFYEELQKQIDEYDALYDTVHETGSTLEELQSTINEINEEIKENQMDLEQAIYDIIVEAWEKEIEEMEKQAEVIKEANDAYIQGLNDALTKEKELYEQDQRISDREQLQRQLSLLRRSGGSASEIANLEEQLDGMLKDEYFNNQQKMIEKIQDANEEQVRKLDEQITIQQESLEYQKETGALWTQVYQVLSQDSAAILAFMAGQSSDFFTKSGLTQQQALEEWSKKVGIYTEDRQRQNYQAEAENNWSSGSIWQDSALSGYQDVYNNLDSEAQTNLQDLYNSAYTQSMLEGMNSDQAHQAAAAKLQEQLEYWKSQQDASNRPDEEDQQGQSQAQKHYWAFTDDTGHRHVYDFDKKASAESYRRTLMQRYIKAFIESRKAVAKVAGADEETIELNTRRYELQAKTAAENKFSPVHKWYSEGGLVDYTGSAIVHGTPSKPEAFLNAKQTAMISEAVKAAGDGGALDGIKSTLAALNSSIKSIVNTNLSESSNFTVAPGAVTINVAKISDTYDIEELSNDVMNRMVSIASKSTNRGVNRR